MILDDLHFLRFPSTNNIKVAAISHSCVARNVDFLVRDKAPFIHKTILRCSGIQECENVRRIVYPAGHQYQWSLRLQPFSFVNVLNGYNRFYFRFV